MWSPELFATPHPQPRQYTISIPALRRQPLVVGEFVLSQEHQALLQRVISQPPSDVVGGLSDLLNKHHNQHWPW